MSNNKIKIYGQLESGVKDGYVTDSEQVCTSRQIMVVGGPLAEVDDDKWPEDWKDAKGNKFIPQGKSLDDVLGELFSKTKDGQVEWSDGIWNPTINNPQIDNFKLSGNTISKTGNDYVVETGATITATISGGKTVSDNVRKWTLTFDKDCGYYKEVENEKGQTEWVWTDEDYTVSQQGTDNSSDVKYVLKWNNSTDVEDGLKVQDGENAIEVTTTLCTASVSRYNEEHIVYASNNMREKLADIESSIGDTGEESTTLKNSSGDNPSCSANVYGSLNCFLGGVAKKVKANDTDISDTVRNLGKKEFVRGITTNGKSISYTLTIPAQGTGIIAVPAGYELLEIKALGAFQTELWKQGTTQNVKIADADSKTLHEYTIYIVSNNGDGSADYDNIKIKKQ
ncbi:MAG: hypothetical protein IKU01_02510 [Bacteroidales bacterium]|nr:hypothetical protein [Bacteroidales bacterium]